MKYEGRVHKFGRDVDTDVIIPARYLNTSDPAELACHCMEDIDAEFSAKVQLGDIIVAGENFGCGSSREHAPMAIKASGVSCVIASSFARIFYRNAINIGLPIIECPEAVDAIGDGDLISVDTNTGAIANLSGSDPKADNVQTFYAQPFPEFIQGIIDAGGLMEYAKKQEEGGGT